MSKVSMLPRVLPVAKLTVRETFAWAAYMRAMKALKRHGRQSYEFWKARRSRWLRGV